MNCLGCHLANKKEEVHLVFEDENVSCILDHQPFNEGHVLILPKQHVRSFDEFDEMTAKSVFKAIKILSKALKKLYNPDGITICQNGGEFDELTHFHMHIIPRYQGQNFADFYIEDTKEDDVEADKLEEIRRNIVLTIKGLDD